MKRLLVILALAIFFPAAAQTMTATLRVQGNVMVATGGDFQPAADNQPVLVGQRILVAENASATIRYGSDCSRSYNDPGVYTIEPGICRDNKDRQDQQDTATEGDVAGAGGSTFTTLGIILGTVIVGAETIKRQDEVAPDRPLSR